MKYVRISSDVWVNLEETESITRNEDGTALIQGRVRIYQSTVPVEAVLTQEEPAPAPQAHVQSPLIAPTAPAW